MIFATVRVLDQAALDPIPALPLELMPCVRPDTMNSPILVDMVKYAFHIQPLLRGQQRVSRRQFRDINT